MGKVRIATKDESEKHYRVKSYRVETREKLHDELKEAARSLGLSIGEAYSLAIGEFLYQFEKKFKRMEAEIGKVEIDFDSPTDLFFSNQARGIINFSHSGYYLIQRDSVWRGLPQQEQNKEQN